MPAGIYSQSPVSPQTLPSYTPQGTPNAAGISPTLNFEAVQVMVDNPTSQWIQIGGTQNFVAPGIMGAIVPIPGTTAPTATWGSPVGIPQPLAVQGQAATLIFLSAGVSAAPSSGVATSTSYTQTLIGELLTIVGLGAAQFDLKIAAGIQAIGVAIAGTIPSSYPDLEVTVVGAVSNITYFQGSPSDSGTTWVPMNPALDGEVYVSVVSVSSAYTWEVWVVASTAPFVPPFTGPGGATAVAITSPLAGYLDESVQVIDEAPMYLYAGAGVKPTNGTVLISGVSGLQIHLRAMTLSTTPAVGVDVQWFSTATGKVVHYFNATAPTTFHHVDWGRYTLPSGEGLGISTYQSTAGPFCDFSITYDLY